MNSQILNNIFLQKSKEKYNPDVNQKKCNLEKVRNENIFKKNNVIYNSITNQIPENIKSNKDLELKKDGVISNLDQLILKKEEERKKLDQEFKSNNPKQKIITNNNISTEEPSTFIEMKNIQTEYITNHNKKIEVNKNSDVILHRSFYLE